MMMMILLTLTFILTFDPSCGHALYSAPFHPVQAYPVHLPVYPAPAYPGWGPVHESYGDTILTCTGEVEDGSGGVNSSIAINIKPAPLLSPGYWGHGGGVRLLQITVNLYSQTSPGDVYLALTERTSDSCDAMGHFLGHGLPPHAIYRTKDSENVYHAPALHYYGQIYNGHHYFGGVNHYHPLPAPDGVIAQTELTDNNKLAQFTIHQMTNYHALAELAGRGMVVCKHNDVVRTYDGHYMCKEVGETCCTLSYDGKERYLDKDGQLME